MNKNASSSFANDPWSAVTSDGPSLSSFGGSCRTRCQTANALYRRTHAGRLNEAQAIYRRDLERLPAMAGSPMTGRGGPLIFVCSKVGIGRFAPAPQSKSPANAARTASGTTARWRYFSWPIPMVTWASAVRNFST